MHNNTKRFEGISFSDKNTVKYLILNRATLDPSYCSSSNANAFWIKSNVCIFNTYLTDVYISLDSIINKCNFTEKRLRLLELLFDGNSIKDICDMDNRFEKRSTHEVLDRIVDNIVNNNKMT